MTANGPVPRYLALAVILAMAAISAVGFWSIRRDLTELRGISQDNFLWSATQMEVELLRFLRSAALFTTDPSDERRVDVQMRFDILWSRVRLARGGRVGTVLRGYDEGQGTLDALGIALEELDPLVVGLEAGDAGTGREIMQALEAYQHAMRLYTLRVVRGDTAAAGLVRERVLMRSQITGGISLAAVLISVLSLSLIMRESTRQRQMAELNRRQADFAEAASRAKSRFLTMMSHELRNPLNGVLGPLALLRQSDLGERQLRLVDQAQQSGRAMLGMVGGLLDYGDIQDDRLTMKREPFRPRALAEDVAVALRDLPTAGAAHIEIVLNPDTPELVWGDLERLRQVFLCLAEYVMQPSDPRDVSIAFEHDGANLIGAIAFDDRNGEMDWKLDLLMGMSDQVGEPFSTDALGPLIARGLIAAARGVLTLTDGTLGERVIRVSVPAERVVFDRIRVHLETRSAALETLYRVALRSEHVIFNPAGSRGPADIVLVDSTSIGEESLMGSLRARHPDALFVALGPPAVPGLFDDILEAPHDMARLRSSILSRLAS